MSGIAVNDKRIAKNTLYLYLRMLVTLVIGLLTGRVTINALGIHDYGLMNVVGGVMGFLGYFSSLLSQGTSRFLTVGLGKGDMKQLRNIFSACATIHIVLDELLDKNKPQKKSSSWRNYIPFLGKGNGNKKNEGKVTTHLKELFTVGKEFNKKKPLIITDENIHQFICPDCCHAIPGDDIMGYIDNKNRIEIHKRSCPVAAKLKSSFGNRIVDAKWQMNKSLFFEATIEIKGIDRKGMLLDVSRVISDQLDVNIHKITISSDNGIFDGTIELKIHDRDDVRLIMDQLKTIEGLQDVQRIL